MVYIYIYIYIYIYKTIINFEVCNALLEEEWSGAFLVN